MQSNALAALEALDTEVAQKVFEEGCVTGDRINGLCDGVTGHWCAFYSWTRNKLNPLQFSHSVSHEQILF